MKNTLRAALAAFLALSIPHTAMAQTGGGSTENSGSKSVTGTQLGSPQTNTPATGSAAAPASTSAQTNAPGSSAVVGPTGSKESDATNPNRSQPTAGGGTGR